MVESSIVFVNTRNIVPLEQTSQNNVVVNLDEPIFVPDDHDCMLSVNQAQIPNSFYTFTEPLAFTVRWNGLTKTITVVNVGTNWITVNSKTNLFVGQQINIQAGTGFGGLQPSTSYFISEIDPTGNRIKLKDFNAQPTFVTSASGINMAVVSVNHINQIITLFSGTNINVGDRIRLNDGWGNILPPNIDYWVVDKPAANQIKISDRNQLAFAIPTTLPNITCIWVAPGGITYNGQVVDVDILTGQITIGGGSQTTLAVEALITFDTPFCGVIENTNYTIRQAGSGVITLRDRNTPSIQQVLTASTPLAQGTIVQQNSPSGSITAKLSTTQTFTIDTSLTASSSGMPGGAYNLASFGATAAATNALVGKVLTFTSGIASAITLSSLTTDRNSSSQLTTKPQLVPKITISFTVTAGTLADFEIINFTNYALGFENQTIVGTGTQAISQPMFSPRYVIIGSSLRTPGQVPGGRTRLNPIATIPIQTTFGSVQSYTPPFPSEQKIDDQVIRSFTLQVYDELGNLVNFNGVEWQAVLEFKMYPKRKPEYKYSW